MRFLYFGRKQSSLSRRRNLPWVSNVCEAALTSLFLAPNEVNECPEGHFEFLFILIGKTTMAFFTANHDAYSNPGTHVRAQNKNFGAVSQVDLTRV